MKVLLVDDQAQPVALHRQLFGDRALVCKSVDALEESLRRGEDYSAAYIDFDLSGGRGAPARTGLSTMLLLEQQRPQCRRIVYTSFGEGGRELFAAAAHRWFGAFAVIDKSSDVEVIEKAATARRNPTPDAWQEKLHRQAHLIDALFAEPVWGDIWPVYYRQAGRPPAIVARLEEDGKHCTPTDVRKFQDNASKAAQAFQSGFLGEDSTYPEGGQNSPRNVVLTSFVHRNAKFFCAPDLPFVVMTKMPWKSLMDTSASATTRAVEQRTGGLLGRLSRKRP